MVCTNIGSGWFLRFCSQNKILNGDLALILTWPFDVTHTEWLRASTGSTNVFSWTTGAEITFVLIKLKTDFLLLAQWPALPLNFDDTKLPTPTSSQKGHSCDVHMVITSTVGVPSSIRMNRCWVQNGGNRSISTLSNCSWSQIVLELANLTLF